jgi:hypothetical protein
MCFGFILHQAVSNGADISLCFVDVLFFVVFSATTIKLLSYHHFVLCICVTAPQASTYDGIKWGGAKGRNLWLTLRGYIIHMTYTDCLQFMLWSNTRD